MKLEVEDEVKTVVFAEAQAYSEWETDAWLGCNKLDI
jgi:hypothetical protein